jgi:sigma-B regulation protein RsbU (phosphoserine phosphatase)
MFVTLVLAVLDPATGRLIVSSAGHPLPILRTPAGAVRDVDGQPGTALGIVADQRFQESEHRLLPGEAVVFYTDGVHDAPNAEHELFGKERLMQVLSRPSQSLGETTKEVIAEIQAFAGPQPASDDITLLGVARRA